MLEVRRKKILELFKDFFRKHELELDDVKTFNDLNQLFEAFPVDLSVKEKGAILADFKAGKKSGDFSKFFSHFEEIIAQTNEYGLDISQFGYMLPQIEHQVAKNQKSIMSKATQLYSHFKNQKYVDDLEKIDMPQPTDVNYNASQYDESLERIHNEMPNLEIKPIDFLKYMAAYDRFAVAFEDIEADYELSNKVLPMFFFRDKLGKEWTFTNPVDKIAGLLGEKSANQLKDYINFQVTNAEKEFNEMQEDIRKNDSENYNPNEKMNLFISNKPKDSRLASFDEMQERAKVTNMIRGFIISKELQDELGVSEGYSLEELKKQHLQNLREQIKNTPDMSNEEKRRLKQEYEKTFSDMEDIYNVIKNNLSENYISHLAKLIEERINGLYGKTLNEVETRFLKKGIIEELKLNGKFIQVNHNCEYNFEGKGLALEFSLAEEDIKSYKDLNVFVDNKMQKCVAYKPASSNAVQFKCEVELQEKWKKEKHELYQREEEERKAEEEKKLEQEAIEQKQNVTNINAIKVISQYLLMAKYLEIERKVAKHPTKNLDLYNENQLKKAIEMQKTLRENPDAVTENEMNSYLYSLKEKTSTMNEELKSLTEERKQREEEEKNANSEENLEREELKKEFYSLREIYLSIAIKFEEKQKKYGMKNANINDEASHIEELMNQIIAMEDDFIKGSKGDKREAVPIQDLRDNLETITDFVLDAGDMLEEIYREEEEKLEETNKEKQTSDNNHKGQDANSSKELSVEEKDFSQENAEKDIPDNNTKGTLKSKADVTPADPNSEGAKKVRKALTRENCFLGILLARRPDLESKDITILGGRGNYEYFSVKDKDGNLKNIKLEVTYADDGKISGSQETEMTKAETNRLRKSLAKQIKAKTQEQTL